MKGSHPYIAHTQHSFAISPLLQSHVLEFANDQPFERAVALLQTALPCAQVSSSQSQRLMQYFGNLEQTESIPSTPGSGFHPLSSSEKAADGSGTVLLVFGAQAERSKWIELRKEELLSGQLDQVIEAVKKETTRRGDAVTKKAEQLMKYYEKNRYRMKYHEYRAKEYCIGSGAIESAIGTVVQQRCKLVGQRWTKRVSAVLNIRAVFKSGKKTELRKLISAQMGLKTAA